MLRSNLVAIALTAMIAPVAGVAQGVQRSEHFSIPVLPMSPSTFEVVENDGAGGTQLWCAAGLYAREVLGQGSGSLYILEERSDSRTVPGRKSVIFSTEPVDGAFSTLTQGVRRAGLSFSTLHAYALCDDTPHLSIEVAKGA